MSSLGRFLEFGVRAPNVLASLGFYRSLGFTELESSDTWPHRYAVVSDGALCIGLHDRDIDAPTVTFVQQDLARHVRSMSDHGFDFSFMHLEEDVFNEVGLTDRDGNRIAMLEARTFHPADEYSDDSVCGSWFEISLPVRDTMRAARFWAAVSPVLLRMREEPTVHMRFEAGAAAVGLSESIALEAPSLCFRCPDKDALAAVVDRHDLPLERFPGYEGAFAAISAPEGTTLYVFDEDFLGETYEVEETDVGRQLPQ